MKKTKEKRGNNNHFLKQQSRDQYTNYMSDVRDCSHVTFVINAFTPPPTKIENEGLFFYFFIFQ